MKTIKKILTIASLSAFCACFSFSIPTHAQSITPPTSVVSASMEITPRKDAIEWRYKEENGYIYRRQYNYTKQKWLGEWEFVG